MDMRVGSNRYVGFCTLRELRLSNRSSLVQQAEYDLGWNHQRSTAPDYRVHGVAVPTLSEENLEIS